MAGAEHSAVKGACGFDSVSVVDRVLVLSVGGLELRLSAGAAQALAEQISKKLVVIDEAEQKRRAVERERELAEWRAELLELGSRLHPEMLQKVRDGVRRDLVITEMSKSHGIDRWHIQNAITRFIRHLREIRARRNSEIISLFNAGNSGKTIAKQFKIATPTVYVIVSRSRKAASHAS